MVMNPALELRALRGATTASANTSEAITEAVSELIETLVRDNGLEGSRLLSVTFSVTADLDACFPAAIARRRRDWDDVALLTASRWPWPAICPAASACWPMPGWKRHGRWSIPTCGRPPDCGRIGLGRRPALNR